MDEHSDLPPLEPEETVNSIIDNYDAPALPSIYKKSEKTSVVEDAIAIVASANASTLPARQVGRYEMMEVLERSLNRTILNLTNPSQRAFTAIREISDFVNMATTGAKPKIAGVHADLLPVGHPLSTKQHNFSQEDVVAVRAEWMSADPRIAEDFRPLVASAFKAPASSLEREYVIAKLEATSATEVPREIILSLTAAGDPYGGGNSFLARSARARAQRRDRKGRFAWMGGGARVWLGTFDGVSTLFRFCGYDANSDSFDLEIFNHPTLGTGIYSIPASKVEAIKAILPDNYLDLPEARPTKVDRTLLVDPATLVKKDAPTGWTKVSSANGVDTFRSADGWVVNRYQNASDAPTEQSITRVRGANVDKTIDPNMPVYHISRGSADGTVTDSPIAMTQSWADTQALVAKHDKLNPDGATFDAEKARTIPEGWTQVEDKNKSDFILRDPTGRYEAISMAPKDNTTRTRQYTREIEQISQGDQSLINPYDGAKDFDGNLESLFRLERIGGDGTREVVGYYQDIEDIERDSEVPDKPEQTDAFFQEVIENTRQWGGNTIDFIDGNAPIDGYIVAHAPDIPNSTGTLDKREEVYPVEVLDNAEDTAKLLRDFAAKNADKLSQKGFYLGTWTEFRDAEDGFGNVVQKEMLFLDVSEYVKDFNDAFDKAEERKEIAWYGVTEGESFYPEKERQRREVFAARDRLKQSVTPEEKKRLYDALNQANQRMNEVNREGNVGPLEWTRDYMDWPNGLEPSEKERLSPEMYQAAMDWLEADKAYKNLEGDYYRAIFEMVDGFDPGGRREGLYGRALQIRDKYVGDDAATLRMNKILRDGGDVPSRAKEMDSLVNKSALKQDFVFFRGVWLDQGVVDEMNAGDSFHDRAFQSMDFDEAGAQMYLSARDERGDIPERAGKARVVLRLVVPKGTNAINVGQGEVVLRRNTKMTVIRKSTGRFDGGNKWDVSEGEDITTTYLDVLVEPQTKEEIDARTQGLVRATKLEPNQSAREFLPDDGRGADGVGTPSPVGVGKEAQSASRATGTRELEAFDPTKPVALAPRNAGGMTANTWWAWERGPDGQQYIDYMRQVACRLTGLPVPETLFDRGKPLNFLLKRGWGAPNEKSIAGMVNAIANSPAQPALFRGLGINDAQGGSSLLNVEVGQTLDMPLASFTRSAGVATWYATDRTKTDGTPVIIKVQEGANGVSVSAKASSYPMDYETVVNGKFEVVGTEEKTMPFWDRSYLSFTVGNDINGNPIEGQAIVGARDFDVPQEILDKVVAALKADRDADLSQFNTETIKFTNDRNQYDRSRSASVWKLSEPKTFKVIELRQIEPLKISDNETQSDSTLLIEPMRAGKNLDEPNNLAQNANKNRINPNLQREIERRQRAQRAREEAERGDAPEEDGQEAINQERDEQIKAAPARAAEIASQIPANFDELLDPNHPLNVISARNITDEIVSPLGGASPQLTADELMTQQLLFLEPTDAWKEIDKMMSDMGDPIAQKIMEKLRAEGSSELRNAERSLTSLNESTTKHNDATRRISNFRETIIDQILTSQQNFMNIDQDAETLAEFLRLYTDPNAPRYGEWRFENLQLVREIANKGALRGNQKSSDNLTQKLAIVLQSIESAYKNDPVKKKEKIKRTLAQVILGGWDTDEQQTESFFSNLTDTHGFNNDVQPILGQLNYPRGTVDLNTMYSALIRAKDDVTKERRAYVRRRKELSQRFSKIAMEVMSEAGLEFNHGVTVSDADLKWGGVGNIDGATMRLIPEQDYAAINALPSELKTRQGYTEIINKALARMPKPVALAIKKWMIDNKSNFTSSSSGRGATFIKDEARTASGSSDRMSKMDDMSTVKVDLGIAGDTKETAIATAVHEMWHMFTGVVLPYQLSGLEWARYSAETNMVDADGKISHIFVNGNSGETLFSRGERTTQEVRRAVFTDELGAWSPNFVAPYVGKYGHSVGTGIATGAHPFLNGELASSIMEGLLGGGLGSGLFVGSGVFGTKKIRSGFNPDGTPRFITFKDSVIAEGLIPFGISTLLVANALAKKALGA
jgi:hypothetical protein